MNESTKKLYCQEVEGLNAAQKELYDAVVEEINRTTQYRGVSGFQAFIEILVKKNILTHDLFYEIDDETLTTSEVAKLWQQTFHNKNPPNQNTVRRYAEEYSLGSRLGTGNYVHSKKKWERFLGHFGNYAKK